MVVPRIKITLASFKNLQGNPPISEQLGIERLIKEEKDIIKDGIICTPDVEMGEVFFIADNSLEHVMKIEDENETREASIEDDVYTGRYKKDEEYHTSHTESTKKDIEHIIGKHRKKMNQQAVSKNICEARANMLNRHNIVHEEGKKDQTNHTELLEQDECTLCGKIIVRQYLRKHMKRIHQNVINAADYDKKPKIPKLKITRLESARYVIGRC